MDYREVFIQTFCSTDCDVVRRLLSSCVMHISRNLCFLLLLSLLLLRPLHFLACAANSGGDCFEFVLKSHLTLVIVTVAVQISTRCIDVSISSYL